MIIIDDEQVCQNLSLSRVTKPTGYPGQTTLRACFCPNSATTLSRS